MLSGVTIQDDGRSVLSGATNWDDGRSVLSGVTNRTYQTIGSIPTEPYTGLERESQLGYAGAKVSPYQKLNP